MAVSYCLTSTQRFDSGWRTHYWSGYRSLQLMTVGVPVGPAGPTVPWYPQAPGLMAALLTAMVTRAQQRQ